MDSQIVAVYCLCDDVLKGLRHPEDPQCQMSDAEVLTTAITAVLYHAGNFELARKHLKAEGYIPNMLGKSRFNRRLHRLQDLILTLFRVLGETWKELNHKSIYAIDSFPVASCDNYRICRSQRYRGEAWRSYQPSKKRYFYGLKIHLLVTEHGQPVEFFLTPGSYSDTSAYRLYDFDLPKGAYITGDKAYNDYDFEDALREAGLKMSPLRKKNSRRPIPPWAFYLRSTYRKIIETTGSLIDRILPKSIHAVTAEGFELKVGLFVLACSLNFLW